MEIHERDELPRLRERRLQRGLTQQEVAEGLERLAWVQSSRRVGVNADMVSKWERGQKSPSRFYLRLLCSFFDATPDQLGYGAPAIAAPAVLGGLEPSTSDLTQVYAALDGANAAVELLQPKMLELWRGDLLTRRQLLKVMGVAPAAAGGLDAIESTLSILPAGRAPEFRGQETLARLEELTHQLESLYHSCDPRRFLLPVRSLIGTVEDFLPDARGREVRRALLGILARANLLAGRLSFFDLHESLNARAYMDLSREAAQEASHPVLSSVVFGHMAFLPAQKRNYPAAASYLSAARDSLSRQPMSLVSSWLSAVESELNTQAGATGQALKCVARANEELPGSSSMPVPVWFDFFDESRLNGFEGFALRKAGDLVGARASLQKALAPSPITGPKQRAVMTIDLAVTCAQGGDLDEGCRLAGEAARDLHQSGYATAVSRLAEFHAALPDQRHPAARLLKESIAELS